MSGASRRGFLAAAAAVATAGGAGAALATSAGREVPLLATYVAGAGRHCGPEAFRRIAPGARLVLRREPGNDYDARSVAVWTPAGEKLGYVPRIHNQALANLMDAGLRPVARVADLSPDGGGARPELRLDVRLALGSDIGVPTEQVEA